MKTVNPPMDPTIAKMGRKIGSPDEKDVGDEKPRAMVSRAVNEGGPADDDRPPDCNSEQRKGLPGGGRRGH